MLIFQTVIFVTLLFNSEIFVLCTNVKVAVAHLISQNVSGSIYFTETEEGIRVNGAITGLRPGLYGFHIHEFGDTSTCEATGPHFDPHGTNHGGRDHEVRHVGDFGNVEFVGNDQIAVASVDFVDNFIAFKGRNNILGRGLVLHIQEDDLGLGDHEMSLISGNAGPRVACGTIGIRSGNWNSGFSVHSSLVLVVFELIFLYFK